MKPQLLAVVTSLSALFACNNNTPKAESVGDGDTQFSNYSDQFIKELWKNNPDWATSVGYHNFDSVLVVPDGVSRLEYKKFIEAQLDSLAGYSPETLSASSKIDYYLIKNNLEESRWNNDSLRSYEWDPSEYNVGESFAFILNESYAPLEDRLRNLNIKLVRVPAYYAAAKAQVANPVPELLSLAIEQNNGSISIFEKDLIDSVNGSALTTEEKDQIKQRSTAAAKSIHDYVLWLTNSRNSQPRSFRLGEELYGRKFSYNIQSAYTAAQIFDSAVARKQYVQRQMASISQQLWPKYFGNTPMPADSLELIGKMIDTLSINHPKQADFQNAIAAIIPSLVSFIKDKNLLYIDSTKPLVVRKEPAYMAGVAGASISAPGPYDKEGNTYYNVGSIENWPADRAESYLREYNDYILQVLDIHEAIPGHYTQLVYANQSPSLIKSILGNGAMIEGWAVYTEQMMLENGYGGNTPEMWLMWYKWHLRAVCNTILDYSVHVKNISKEQALYLLTKEAFQQKAEAEGKWKRVSVTSVQLTSYYTGYKEIYDLRETYKSKLGKDFDLKAFHEKFLSYGNAPVKYIRQLMLQ
jgi:uncharacterized protein (DUF885 family)